jgi:hypothetical protein
MSNYWLSLLLFFLSLVVVQPASAQFTLKDGDRVVILGGTLVEREQSYGYWETMLVSHYPDRNIAVRNLGSSGDTVWAADRLKQLKPQIESIRPSVVFVAFGTHEAPAGEPGLPRFRDELDALLDMLATVGKPRVVLIAPLKVETMGPPQNDPESQNRDRWHYADLLHEVAVRRDDTFVDLNRWLEALRHAQAGKRPFWTDDGEQLNQLGYWLTAAALENDLLLRPSGWNLKLDATGKILEASGARVEHVRAADRELAWELRSQALPLSAALREPAHSGQLRIEGLAAGRYRLEIDGRSLAEADSAEWQGGVALDVHAELKQLEGLRRAIVRKNELYCRRDRPQDATRLFGNRQPEEAPKPTDIEKLLTEQEAAIAKLRVPATYQFKLIAAGPGPSR